MCACEQVEVRKTSMEIAPELLDQMVNFVKENARIGEDVKIICDSEVRSYIISKTWTVKTAEEIRKQDECKMSQLEADLTQLRKKYGKEESQ